MKKFEVPYNFEDDYFIKLNKYPAYYEYIKFIYLPAFKEGKIQNTREDCFQLNSINYTDYNNYSNIIKKIQSYNIDVAILIQKNATMNIIKKYIEDFNIKYFIINDDKLAKKLKEKYNDKIYLILSITRAITEKDLLEKDLSMYDEIVLFFWFNKHLDHIKTLPTKYKYSIMANCYCDPNCKRHDMHWYKNTYMDCPVLSNNIYIFPEDLLFFDKYINTYKLVDRISPSEEIFDNLKIYVDAYKNMSNYTYNEEREKRYIMQDGK